VLVSRKSLQKVGLEKWPQGEKEAVQEAKFALLEVPKETVVAINQLDELGESFPLWPVGLFCALLLRKS